jgi:hypothetical protein
MTSSKLLAAKVYGLKTNMRFFQLTERMVADALRSGVVVSATPTIKSIDALAADLIDTLDHKLIAKQAQLGSASCQQTEYALEEIVSQLCARGVLSPNHSGLSLAV